MTQEPRDCDDLWENASCALHASGPDQVIECVNATWLRWLGYEREEVVGKLRFTDLLSPLARISSMELLPGLLAAGRLDDVKLTLVRKDGSTLTALVSATAKYDASGAFRRARTCFIDISERTRAEEALRREGGPELPMDISPIEPSDAIFVATGVHDITEHRQAELATSRLAAIVASSVDAIFGRTLDGVITSWNRAAEILYGYTAEEVLGYSMAMLIPDDRTDEEMKLQQGILRGEPVEHFETVRLRKNSARIDVSVTISPVHDRRGKLIGASYVARDFSARKRAEAAERLASDRLADAIECLDAGFAIFDPNKCLIMHNSAYQAFFMGAVDGPLIGRTASELLELWMTINGVEHVRPTISAVDRFAVLDVPHMIDELRANGRVYREVMRKTREGGVVLIASDRTEDDQREEVLRKASAAKSDFLSSMSHELRTPLNAVIGFGQLLQFDRHAPLLARHRDMVDHIVKGGEHLLSLIDEVLDLARVEAGSVAISLEVVDVSEVLEQILATLEPLASRAGIELRTVGEIKTVPPVIADRTRFSQILMNFASNAIKYSLPNGQATFKTSIVTSGRVRVSVSDRGIGIPLAEQDKIFQPFFRAGQETGSIEGTGIGLAITRRLAELMGGAIGFESAPGRGSEFWIELPRALEHQGPAVKIGAVQSSLTNLNYQHVIIYIEDHPANIAFMRALLAQISAIELITAPTAEIGIELVRVRQPTAVILDINLPGMSGLEAMRILRSWPETRDIPVIGLSAAAMAHDIERARDAGFYSYLTKPVRVIQLTKVLEELLKPRE